jgi:hypothetical protein
MPHFAFRNWGFPISNRGTWIVLPDARIDGARRLAGQVMATLRGFLRHQGDWLI